MLEMTYVNLPERGRFICLLRITSIAMANTIDLLQDLSNKNKFLPTDLTWDALLKQESALGFALVRGDGEPWGSVVCNIRPPAAATEACYRLQNPHSFSFHTLNSDQFAHAETETAVACTSLVLP